MITSVNRSNAHVNRLLDRFDVTVLVAVVGLIAAIGLVIQHGNQFLPRIVYMGPVSSIVQNLYLADPNAKDPPASVTALTTSTFGVQAHDVTRDGRTIVYSALLG